jgi:hypothetical protein
MDKSRHAGYCAANVIYSTPAAITKKGHFAMTMTTVIHKTGLGVSIAGAPWRR